MTSNIGRPEVAGDAPAATDAKANGLRRVEFVDGIRALAALFVVAHHVYLTAYPGFPVNTGPHVLAPLIFGHFGVAIFMVVSGFSLALAPAGRGWHLGSGGYREFMRRRAWRILPPYWAAIVVSVALNMLVDLRTHDAVGWKGAAAHFFLVQDLVDVGSPNGAFWSIAVEWQLYWIFPLLLLFICRRPGPLALTATVLVFVCAIHIADDRWGASTQRFEHHLYSHALVHPSPQMAALFVYGLLAAAITSRYSAVGSRWWGHIAVIVTAVVIATCMDLGTVRAVGDFYWLDLVLGVAVASALACLTSAGTSRVRRALEWTPLVALGQFSYSLYLIHAPLLAVAWVFLVKRLGLGTGETLALMVGVFIPVIVIVSYGFHLAVERPFMRYRSWAELRAASMAHHHRPLLTTARI